MFEQKIQNILHHRHCENNYRRRQINNSSDVLNFCSNDYLGLKNHPNLIAAVKKTVDEYGIGSGSAYLLTGYCKAHQALEEELAEFLNFPRVLLFSSGYMANLGIISALLNRNDVIFADKSIHASLIDGCLLSKAKMHRYPHANLNALDNLLQRTKGNHKLIISEGIFGMDGTLIPLQQLISIAKKHSCSILLDDAHAIGVLGEHGRGCLEYFNVKSSDITLLVGTLGKACGTYGAFVASNEKVCELLIQVARTYLFTTALPPILAEASRASLKIIRDEPERRIMLHNKIERFQIGARQLNIPLMHSNKIPVQLIHIGDNKKTSVISEELLQSGLLIKPILPPTVPKHTARLRITITAKHSNQNIDYLLERLAYVIKKYS